MWVDRKGVEFIGNKFIHSHTQHYISVQIMSALYCHMSHIMSLLKQYSS